jgi:hypothetical protein
MTAARRLALGLIGALLAPASPARAQGAPLWRAVDLSRQLRDSLPQRIRVQYGAGNVDVRPSDEPLLYAMHLRYDERRGVPLHRYDPEQHSALLGIESRSGGGLRVSSDEHDEAGELRLALPRTVPLDLELELGGTRSALDLGGLALQSLRLECGATDATLVFGTPNRTHMRDMEIDVGAADLSASHLANANADQIRVRGGVGVVDLEFGGTWTRDLVVSTRLAIGKLILRVPSDVGVRLDVQRLAASFEHEGLVKRADGWYSENWDQAPHKLRVHAETVFGKIEVRHGVR